MFVHGPLVSHFEGNARPQNPARGLSTFVEIVGCMSAAKAPVMYPMQSPWSARNHPASEPKKHFFKKVFYQELRPI